MDKSLYDYCIEKNRDELLTQWHPTKNKGMELSSMAPFSNKKAWWICEKGHEFEMTINHRTSRQSSCPYCQGNQVLAGFNDLETVDPQLAKEWHPTRNETLTARMVMAGSRKKVWWRCEKGHEWQAEIKNRHSGKKCPVCANRVLIPGKNDLETVCPTVAAQWHPTKNEPLTPKDVFAFSLRKVWWVCGKGHEWRAAISSRSEGRGCPICSGKVIIPGDNDLASRYPAIALQWHPTKNGNLSPENVTAGSSRKVWWQCQFGHVWKTKIWMRAKKNYGCPVCKGRYKEERLAQYRGILNEQP